MAIRKPFRVHSRGFVHLFYSEVELGRWLGGEALFRNHITITYGITAESSTSEPRNVYSLESRVHVHGRNDRNMKVIRLRFEDDALRIEDPKGNCLGSKVLVDCIRASENERREDSRSRWSIYSSGAKSRWHRGSVYRIVRTQNERRQDRANDAEAEAPKARPARKNSPKRKGARSRVLQLRLGGRQRKSFRSPPMAR